MAKRSSRIAVAMAVMGAVLALQPGAALAHAPGRMTGGGSVFTQGGIRVTHGFQMHCVAPEGGAVIEPNNLEINWQGNKFHLEQLLSGACSDEPGYDEGNPEAGFDTYRGSGLGRCNGQSGAMVYWTVTDAGEPGVNDMARFSISCPGLQLSVEGLVSKGNHQAHGDNKAADDPILPS